MRKIASELRLLATSCRHTTPQQLWHRARLRVKRRATSYVGQIVDLAGALESRKQCSPALASEPPIPVFPPRRALLSPTGESVLLVNHPWPLTNPMRWHAEELERGTRLEKLHLHYMEYLEAVDHDGFSRLVVDWIDQNPPFQCNYWLDSWNSYATSIRAVVWMQQLAVRRAAIAPRVHLRIERSLKAQLRFLASNLERDIGGNHLIKNVKALLWAGRFFSDTEGRRWSALGEQVLQAELANQILPDGVHFELSPAYHAQVFADLLECAHVLSTVDVRVTLMRTLEIMAQALADLTHPDGLVSLLNDGGLHMTYPVADCLAVYERFTGRVVSGRERFAFEDAGIYGVRANGDLVVADFGQIGPPHLPAHSHGDVFSFEWTVGGRRAVVDAGVFEYNDGDMRRYSRATTSHNTVTVDDQDQGEFWKSFRVGRRPHVRLLAHHVTEKGFVVEGSHTGFSRLAGAPVHERVLTASPTAIRVEDAIVGGAGQPVVARLLLHPDFTPSAMDGGIRASDGEVAIVLHSQHHVSVHDAWWCPDFNVKLPTKQMTIHYGTAPCRGMFEIGRTSA